MGDSSMSYCKVAHVFLALQGLEVLYQCDLGIQKLIPQEAFVFCGLEFIIKSVHQYFWSFHFPLIVKSPSVLHLEYVKILQCLFCRLQDLQSFCLVDFLSNSEISL